MTDTPPEFAEDVRPCTVDSGRREAGGKELAEQKAEENRAWHHIFANGLFCQTSTFRDSGFGQF